MSRPSGWHRKNRDTAAERARQRKYDSPEHRTTRAYYAPLVAAGLVRCWRCGARLVPGRWQLGHDDDDPSITRGPECTPCNLRAAAAKGARIVRAARKARRQAETFTRPQR